MAFIDSLVPGESAFRQLLDAVPDNSILKTKEVRSLQRMRTVCTWMPRGRIHCDGRRALTAYLRADDDHAALVFKDRVRRLHGHMLV